MVREWAVSNHRGTILLTTLSLVSAVLAFVQYRTSGDVRWIVGGLVILTSWPYECYVMVPVSIWLCAIPPEKGSAPARRLMRDWGLLEWGYTLIGLAACGAFAWALELAVIDGRQRHPAANVANIARTVHRQKDPMLHIDIPTIAEFRDPAQLRAEFCIFLYTPTTRLGANAEANRTLFRDLAKEALARLRKAGVNRRVIGAFERRFEQLVGEHDRDQDKVRQRRRAKPDESLSFWHHQGNGLCLRYPKCFTPFVRRKHRSRWRRSRIVCT
jgi:hypothetical protein